MPHEAKGLHEMLERATSRKGLYVDLEVHEQKYSVINAYVISETKQV